MQKLTADACLCRLISIYLSQRAIKFISREDTRGWEIAHSKFLLTKGKNFYVHIFSKSLGVCLLIFEQNSTQHVLIPYHTFIGFRQFFQSTLKIEQKVQSMIVNFKNVHTIFISFSTPYFYQFWEIIPIIIKKWAKTSLYYIKY